MHNQESDRLFFFCLSRPLFQFSLMAGKLKSLAIPLIFKSGNSINLFLNRIVMKKVFVAITMVLTACGTGGKSDNTSDTTIKNAASGGNSDGANTIGTDTAHLD